MSYILKKFFRKAFNINPKLIFLFAFAFLVLNGFVMVLIEPETFEGDFPFIRAVWYVLITSTTIGYGDLYPNTTLGKLYAMIFIIPIGIGLMGGCSWEDIRRIHQLQKEERRRGAESEGKKSYCPDQLDTKSRTCNRGNPAFRFIDGNCHH